MKMSLSRRPFGLALALCSVLAAGLFTAAVPVSAVTLPDGRAYEEVTPVHMNGAATESVAVRDDGQAVIYKANDAFTGPSAGEGTASGAAPYEAQRTSTGWQTSELLPPGSQYRGEGFNSVSPDFSTSLVKLAEPFDEAESAPSTRCYVQAFGGSGGAVTPTSEIDTTPQGGHSYCNIQFTEEIGSSSDLSHIFIENPVDVEFPIALVPGSPSGAESEQLPSLVEDYETGAGVWHYRLVGVSGPNNPDGSGSVISDCGTVLGDNGGQILGGSGRGSDEHTAFNAISTDGSTVFFTALSPGGKRLLCSGPSVNELFARVGGSQTVPISEPSTSYCPASNPNPVCANAQFEGASADGSKVFFTTTQPEVPGVVDSTTNLYEAQLASSGGVTSVAGMVQVSAGDTSGAGAQVQGVVRISDDGSHVYFVARGVLTTNPSPDAQGYNAHGEPVSSGAVAQPGADNLYVYDKGVTSFIGDLCSGAHASGSLTDAFCGANLSFFGPNDGGLGRGLWGIDAGREAVAAPYGSSTSDGRFLAFTSYADLTLGDTSTARQVFEYDTQTGDLARVSSGQNGFNDNGNNDSFNATIPAPNYMEDKAGVEQTNRRPISNDGSFVFFTTSEPLQRNDVNNAPDVYEWHDGQVSLISDGQNPNTETGANTFDGSSANGSDVFVTTPNALVPGGGAGISNIYDARIGGGFPVAPVAPPCSEDACQGALSPTPTAPSIATATYTGGANLAPPASTPALKVKPLTRAQQLAKALKACKKESKGKRARCRASARKRYGAKPKPKAASRRSSR
jgi:hypothetical protein